MIYNCKKKSQLKAHQLVEMKSSLLILSHDLDFIDIYNKTHNKVTWEESNKLLKFPW